MSVRREWMPFFVCFRQIWTAYQHEARSHGTLRCHIGKCMVWDGERKAGHAYIGVGADHWPPGGKDFRLSSISGGFVLLTSGRPSGPCHELKDILAYKEVLAHIMTTCVPKYRDCTIFEDEYEFAHAHTMGGTASEMCNLGQGILGEGIEDGANRERLQNIRSLMKKLEVTASEAMDIRDSGGGTAQVSEVFIHTTLNKYTPNIFS